jgi:hypothetical protein
MEETPVSVGARWLSHVGWCGAVAQQQPSRAARIGFIEAGSKQANLVFLTSFGEGLLELGWVEGRNITIEARNDLLPEIIAGWLNPVSTYWSQRPRQRAFRPSGLSWTSIHRHRSASVSNSVKQEFAMRQNDTPHQVAIQSSLKLLLALSIPRQNQASSTLPSAFSRQIAAPSPSAFELTCQSTTADHVTTERRLRGLDHRHS